MKEKTIILPAELGTRRRLLEANLEETVTAIVEQRLQERFKAVFYEAEITEGAVTVEWDFGSEYDDEGGYDTTIESLWFSIDGEDIDEDEVYEETGVFLPDTVRDIMYDYVSDVEQYNITSVTINLNQEAEEK